MGVQEFIDQQNAEYFLTGKKFTEDDAEMNEQVKTEAKKQIEKVVKDNTKLNLIISKYFDNKNIHRLFNSRAWVKTKYPRNSIVDLMMASGGYKLTTDVAIDILLFENMVKEANQLKQIVKETKTNEELIKDIEEIEGQIDKIAEVLTPEATEKLLKILDDYKKILSEDDD